MFWIDRARGQNVQLACTGIVRHCAILDNKSKMHVLLAPAKHTTNSEGRKFYKRRGT